MSGAEVGAGQHFLRRNSGTTALGEIADTAYLGVREGLSYLAPFVEGRFFREEHGERTEQVADLAACWRSLDVDLAVLAAPADVVAALAEPGDVRAVARIHQIVRTGDGPEQVIAGLSKRERKRRFRAEQDGFGYDVSHADDDFFRFYRTMHVPTMRHRYGALARSVEETTAHRDIFRAGILFRVHRNGEWVAGSVSRIDRERGVLDARLLGVKDGDDQYRLLGAQNFVYHAILDWATGPDGVTVVDFQGCEPFLTKGTFQYKKRFGTTAVLPGNVFGGLRMLIRARKRTGSVRRFLVENPVLAESDGELVAQYFRDATHPPRSDIPWAAPGIARAITVDLDRA